MHSLAMMLAHGDGVKSNAKQAKIWFEKAAAHDYPASLRELGLIYKEGMGAQPDEYKARHYMARAASLGDEIALEWIEEHLPQKPDWLVQLMAPPKDAGQ
jgi:TPR repeat protein